MLKKIVKLHLSLATRFKNNNYQQDLVSVNMQKDKYNIQGSQI